MGSKSELVHGEARSPVLRTDTYTFERGKRRIKSRRTGFNENEVGFLQLVAGYWVCAILGDVLENESALIDFSRLD